LRVAGLGTGEVAGNQVEFGKHAVIVPNRRQKAGKKKIPEIGVSARNAKTTAPDA
jgi:hypothetical protein